MQFLFCALYVYSVTGKQWTLALNEKSLVFLTVKIYKILYASTCNNYSYIYKVKKPAEYGNPDL